MDVQNEDERRASVIITSFSFVRTMLLPSSSAPVDAPPLRHQSGDGVLPLQRSTRTVPFAPSPRSSSPTSLTAADPTSSTSMMVVTNGLKPLVKEWSLDELHHLGGAACLVDKLASDAENGINGSEDDLHARKAAFGSNTYPKAKPKGFFRFVYEVLNDLFIIILLASAVVSLAFGIKEHNIKEGWYEGASILLAIFLVSAVSNFCQTERFEQLSAECNNISVTVVRDGHRQDVSIFDIVVGDVVFLKIGDQVPTNGVFLQGHSLQIDESSMIVFTVLMICHFTGSTKDDNRQPKFNNDTVTASNVMSAIVDIFLDAVTIIRRREAKQRATCKSSRQEASVGCRLGSNSNHYLWDYSGRIELVSQLRIANTQKAELKTKIDKLEKKMDDDRRKMEERMKLEERMEMEMERKKTKEK
ncbi:hypothetical protein Cni_G19659 [Canna indica]|uniref:Cation-transporting P-type ATPase N-terminal domain-containing protein n=1 Tax=Canna indica TaxID=4628 RepID=A0AAQ3KLN9_9LILI|nr:hypothetical protein Cni_G19659 [Canna indica]